MVCGSNVKETKFFHEVATSDIPTVSASYARHFDRCGETEKVIMEASPTYLRGGKIVASRIHVIIPDAKLLFVLRDPVDRLYSQYNFREGKLMHSKAITFEQYIDRYMTRQAEQAPLEKPGVGERRGSALTESCYADYLDGYFQIFPSNHIKIMFFENLNRDVLGFMQELSAFLEIDPAFYESYNFRRLNATFSGNLKWLHRMAVFVNDRSERFLRHRPELKQNLVGAYKAVNLSRVGYEPMSNETRAMLRAFYRPSVERLARYVDATQIPWDR
jgi:hypothetical protein